MISASAYSTQEETGLSREKIEEGKNCLVMECPIEE
jgi:hypothetical protein